MTSPQASTPPSLPVTGCDAQCRLVHPLSEAGVEVGKGEPGSWKSPVSAEKHGR